LYHVVCITLVLFLCWIVGTFTATFKAQLAVKDRCKNLMNLDLTNQVTQGLHKVTRG